MNPVVNLVAFNLLWVAIVYSAARGVDAWGMAALLGWLPVHIYLTKRRRADLSLLLALVALGPLLDTLFEQTGLISFAGKRWHPEMAPLWLAALWGNFALIVNHSISAVVQRPLLAAAFGAAGGPLAYVGGAQLGAAQLAEPLWQPLVALAILWAVLVPAIGYATTRLGGPGAAALP